MSFLQKKGRFLTGADGGQRVSGRVLRKKRERGMPSVNTSAVADQPTSSTPSPRTARPPGTPTPRVLVLSSSLLTGVHHAVRVGMGETFSSPWLALSSSQYLSCSFTPGLPKVKGMGRVLKIPYNGLSGFSESGVFRQTPEIITQTQNVVLLRSAGIIGS